jgi:Zn-dependent protease
VSICLHEFAHAFVAYRSGDRDVEVRGYLTLNPFRYVNPLLSIVLPLVFIALGGIGLPGGAVYLHRHAFRSKLALSVAALVGPLTNLIFAAVLLYVARTHGSAEDPHLLFWSGVAFLGLLQVSAAALNLLPIPGLDGYAVLEPHLDPATARSFEKIKPFGLIAVFALLSVHQLNVWFFDVVYRIYDVSGAPESLAALGYDVFRFWKAL